MPKKFLIISLTILCLLALIPLVTTATGVGDALNDLNNTAQSAKIITSPDSALSAYQILGRIINLVLSFLGGLFLLLIIYGGIVWMTAAGNEEKVKKASGLMSHAAIGLIIVLFAFLLTNFVIFRIIGIANPTSSNSGSTGITNDTACTNTVAQGGKGGVCQDITTTPCTGGTVFTGLCTGPNNRKCCVINS